MPLTLKKLWARYWSLGLLIHILTLSFCYPVVTQQSMIRHCLVVPLLSVLLEQLLPRCSLKNFWFRHNQTVLKTCWIHENVSLANFPSLMHHFLRKLCSIQWSIPSFRIVQMQSQNKIHGNTSPKTPVAHRRWEPGEALPSPYGFLERNQWMLIGKWSRSFLLIFGCNFYISKKVDIHMSHTS